jgi:hypothetical protein
MVRMSREMQRKVVLVAIALVVVAMVVATMPL